MYLENSNGQQEDNDLKFIPLNIKEPFRNKDSSWYPAIDTSLPTLSNIANNFIMGLSVPVDNSNLEVRSFRTLDYLPRSEMNLGNPMKQALDNPFNNNQMLEQQINNSNMYNNTNPNNNSNINPNNMSSSANNQMNPQKQQLSGDAIADLDYPSETTGEELYSYNKAEGCKSKNSKREDIIYNNSTNTKENTLDMNNLVNEKVDLDFEYEEFEINLIHMELLRGMNEDTSHSNFFRGESYNLLEEIDDIFNIIKDDEDIINIFKAYNVPAPIYNLVINKIIKRTLENTTYKRGE